MEIINFPKFNIPVLDHKKVSPGIYDEWNSQNASCLTKMGMRDKRRQDLSRVPVSQRFVLK
ncbi:MAG: hypothetical protein A2283_15155 [Lentisphaerae bacterium RIFOXYA12_FULL_48_11]|nr:MAG: hypothetical protein A2283_15155 [Lentisphaerae bacterium RIFOXYA12_FULL_48_11]